VHANLELKHCRPVRRSERCSAHRSSHRVLRVGIHNNFFDLGGDLMRCLEVYCLARDKGLYFSLQQFLQHPRIFELIQALSGGSSASLSDAIHLYNLIE
jgi:hypothetical protein